MSKWRSISRLYDAPNIKRLLDRLVVKEELVDRIANPNLQVAKVHDLKLFRGCCLLPYNY